MTDKHIGSNFDDFLKEECIEFEEQEFKKTKLRKNRKDLTGMKFGKLLCLKPVKTGKNNHSEWLCECECGNLKVAQTYRLLSGRVQTCGDCYHTTNHYIPMIKELKQECEELKEKCKKYGEINEQETKDYAELKAENEELKNFHINLVGVKECEIKELVKYKQTLTEIKQLLEDALEYFHDSDTGSTYDKIELILQKCEVIDG